MPREIDIIPFAKNNLPADYLFTQRKYYTSSPDVYLQGDGLSKPIDIWYDRPLWGKVDTEMRVIIPNVNALKPISSDLFTINFVADAYADFRSFALRARDAYRSSMSSFIDVGNPKKAYYSSFYQFQDYFIDTIQTAFLDDFLTDKKREQINSFIDFSKEYLLFMTENLTVPHSLCGFIMSPLTGYRQSGLIIEFSNDNYDDDSNKWTNYLSSDFFEDYIKIAASYGFYVNKNAPWSIVANLNSIRMKKYMAPYGVINDKQTFNAYYFQAEEISYLAFRNLMISSYFLLITSVASITEKITLKNCMKKTIRQSKFKTEIEFVKRYFELGDVSEYTFEEFAQIYSEEVYFDVYMDLRLTEEGIKLSPKEKERLKDITLNMISKKSLSAASVYFSNYLAKKRAARFKDLTDKKFSLKIPSQQTSGPSFSGTGGTSY